MAILDNPLSDPEKWETLDLLSKEEIDQVFARLPTNIHWPVRTPDEEVMTRLRSKFSGSNNRVIFQTVEGS